jgi:hypothetical protein
MNVAQSETDLLKSREYKKAAALLPEKQKLASILNNNQPTCAAILSCFATWIHRRWIG